MHKAELWPVWAEDTTYFYIYEMNKLHKDSLYNKEQLKICCCMSQCIFGTSLYLNPEYNLMLWNGMVKEP